LIGRWGDFRGALGYFGFFSLTLLYIPVAGILGLAAAPLEWLAACGFQLGHWQRSLALLASGLPLCVLAGFIGSRDPALQRQYPFAKSAMDTPRRFRTYASAYFLFYYLPWEVTFRGWLFFPLIPLLGLGPALAIQTMISTLYHIGHPQSEIISACGAGFVFGLVAWWTGSFWPTWLLHAAVGIATDSFLARRHRHATP
jgi:membrane protease YdiL (CAAX protease family)